MSEDRELRTRQLFASARREEPSAALRARVLAAGLQELEQPPQSRPPAARRVALRWRGAGVVAVLALAAAVLLCLGPGRERSGPASSESASDVVISAEPHAAGARGVGAVEERIAKEAAPMASAPPEFAPQVLEAQPPAHPVAPAPRPAAPRAVTSARASVPSAPADGAETAPRAAPQPAARAAPSSLGDQLAQLQRARAALRSGQAAQALELLDAYQSQLDGQAFGAEATLLRIEALAATGQKERAAESAQQFARDYPNSPLIDRAQSLASQLSGAGGAGSEAPP
jgi:hypothetical protein